MKITSPLPNDNKINYLNGIAGLAYSQDFVPIGKYYASMDPRTIDVTRNMRTVFDAPPFESPNTQPLRKIYSDPGYKTGYAGVFNSGSVRYYTDIEIADPYGTPPYVIPSEIYPTLFVDPMGGIRPYYEKVPLTEKSNEIFEYSFDQDQLNWREDLMSKQQEKQNSRQWDIYQLFNDPETFFPNYFQETAKNFRKEFKDIPCNFKNGQSY